MGLATEETLAFAAGLLLRYSKHYDPRDARICREIAGELTVVRGIPDCVAADAKSLVG
jgi:hypothetical protein